MILVSLLVIPFAAGVVAWALAGRFHHIARLLCIGALAVELAVLVHFWVTTAGDFALGPSAGEWFTEVDVSWIPELGIRFHLAMDGLSLVLLSLTMLVGLVSIAASWTEIRTRVGFFHFNIMFVLASLAGVFMAIDLFLFYFFWELFLVPMYLTFVIYGHERRLYAGIKFFIFTQTSGLFMLLSIIGLVFVHYHQTGVLTFDFAALRETTLSPATGAWLLAGFLAACLVKLPSFPLHTWLPDAHTEAPTAGSAVLAGLMIKTGAYGLIRFVPTLFPDTTYAVAPILAWLGTIGVVYGAVLAFAQTDMKRLVAYTSIGHMGFALLGIFSGTRLALEGVVLQLVSHGFSTSGLFLVAGMLHERLNTREMPRMGGLWSAMPRMGGLLLVLAMATLGLPGLGNFIAEYMILFGSYERYPLPTVIAAGGLVLVTIYSVYLLQRSFHGPVAAAGEAAAGEAAAGEAGEPGAATRRPARLYDLTVREATVLGIFILALLWLGWYPQPVINVLRGLTGGLVP